MIFPIVSRHGRWGRRGICAHTRAFLMWPLGRRGGHTPARPLRGELCPELPPRQLPRGATQPAGHAPAPPRARRRGQHLVMPQLLLHCRLDPVPQHSVTPDTGQAKPGHSSMDMQNTTASIRSSDDGQVPWLCGTAALETEESGGGMMHWGSGEGARVLGDDAEAGAW